MLEVCSQTFSILEGNKCYLKYYGQSCWYFAAKEEGSGKESAEWCFIFKSIAFRFKSMHTKHFTFYQIFYLQAGMTLIHIQTRQTTRPSQEGRKYKIRCQIEHNDNPVVIVMFIEQPSKSLGFLLQGLEINIRHSSFFPEASCLPGNRAHHLLRPLTGKQHLEVFTQNGDSLQDFF